MTVAESLPYFLPELALMAAAFLVLVLDLFVPAKKWLGFLMLAGITAAALCVRFPESPVPLFYGLFQLDPFSVFFKVVALLVMAITLLLVLSSEGLPAKQEGELYALLGFLTVGLIMMGSSTHLMMIFLSIEFVSITSYILAGYQKNDTQSNEAALKYLLFGSVASAVMLYGMSLLYGFTRSTELMGIRYFLEIGNTPAFLLHLALTLVLVGFAFKISAAPFHMWAPDVYTGAPTPVTAFLTVGPKALGFAVLLRVLLTAFPSLTREWSAIIAVISALTMTLGNITAISQTNIKRLLAYSSIAQAGYILMGVAASSAIGLNGVLVYLVAYALTNLGAFACVIAASNNLKSEDIHAYAGLAKRDLFLAVSLTVFFVSLAGLPPLAGYIGKFFVFASAVEGNLIGLAVIAALNSAVAAFYYFKVVKEMFFGEPSSNAPLVKPAPLMTAVLVTLAGVLVFGIFPRPLLQFIEMSLSF